MNLFITLREFDVKKTIKLFAENKVLIIFKYLTFKYLANKTLFTYGFYNYRNFLSR